MRTSISRGASVPHKLRQPIQPRRGRRRGFNRSLAAHALVAQEAERRRVGREMHDDLAQNVALLEFQIEAMTRRLRAEPQVVLELESLRGCVAMLAEDVHRICHRLHPVILDNLGLVRGIQFLCEEHTRTSGIKAEFLHGDLPDQLPVNLSLCIYRVVQEALQNVARHSKAPEATVTLHKTRTGIRVVVCDNGCGFDPNAVAAKSRLGLVFASERVKLVGGRCMVCSAPGKGTRISAFVPLSASEDP